MDKLVKITGEKELFTLTGDLIEVQGTMSGGGKPRSGGMSSRPVEEYSEAEVREFEN